MSINLEEKLLEADKLASETLYEYKSLNELQNPVAKFNIDIADLFKITLKEMLSTPEEDVVINVPLSLSPNTSKNKSRLLAADRNSPVGMIIKDPSVYRLLKITYAIGQFKAADILKWVRTYHPKVIKQLAKETQKN